MRPCNSNLQPVTDTTSIADTCTTKVNDGGGKHGDGDEQYQTR